MKRTHYVPQNVFRACAENNGYDSKPVSLPAEPWHAEPVPLWKGPPDQPSVYLQLTPWNGGRL